MIYGIGVDILELDRLRKYYNRYGLRFFKRIMTEKEYNYCLSYKDPIPHFGARITIKEAFSKALGTGIMVNMGWKQLEVLNDERGKPSIKLNARIYENFPILKDAVLHCSVSHSEKSVVGFVIIELKTH